MFTYTRVTSSRCDSVIDFHADAAFGSDTGPATAGTSFTSGNAPKMLWYSERYRSATRCAYWARVPPCSTGLSRGPSACAHWLSFRPSQKRKGEYAVAAIGIVRRLVVPTPAPR